MKKTRFKENLEVVDKKVLRKQRSEVFGLALFVFIFTCLSIALIKSTALPNSLRVIDLILIVLSAIIFGFVIYSSIICVKSLYKLTETIYQEPSAYFWGAIASILLGIFVFPFLLIGMLSLWVDVSKVLKTKSVS